MVATMRMVAACMASCALGSAVPHATEEQNASAPTASTVSTNVGLLPRKTPVTGHGPVVHPSSSATPSKSLASSLTMTAIIGTATPLHHGGDITGKRLHDEISQQLDAGCQHNPPTNWQNTHQCPNSVVIDDVRVLQGSAPTSGTLTLVLSDMNYRDEQTRGALIAFIAGAAQGLINTESSKNVSYRTTGESPGDPRWNKRFALLEDGDPKEGSDDSSDESARVESDEGVGKREAFQPPMPPPVTKSIAQAFLPPSIQVAINEKGTGEMIGQVTLLPDWEADQSNVFSQMMCELAIGFIKSSVMDVVTGALEVASAISGTDVSDPCSLGFG